MTWKTAPFALLLWLMPLFAQEQKRIYLAPDDHTDYMWTGDEEQYRRAFIEMIDYYLDLADKTQSSPAELQSRWNCDGTLWFWTYEKNKTPAQFQRLIDRVRDGHVSVPLNTLVSTYGGTPTEAVLRGMYYAGSLERRFNIKIPMAIAMEDQTIPYGLGSLWAGSGAKYSWKGICGCLTKIPRTGRRPHEIYWWKGDDNSRILMKWNTMLVGNSGARTMGGYAEARYPEREVTFVDQDPAFHAVYPFPVVGIFGKGWDDLKTLTDEFVTTAKKMTTPDRKVIVSNMTDFFTDFEAKFGKTLPDFSASFGNEWDLYTASVSELSAQVRRSVEKLRTAEAMSAIVSQQDPTFLDGRKIARDRAWMNLGMFWEHNWTADGNVISRAERANWGRRIAAGVQQYVDTLHADASYRLGGLIQASGPNRRFYVFNSLSWTRDDFADVAYDGAGPVHVVEVASGVEVPSQFVTKTDDRGDHPHRYLRIDARALPPVGYKTYEVRQGAGQAFAAAATVTGGDIIENSIYKLKVENRGAIRSLIDKTQANREFAGSLENGRLVLNDLGSDVGTLEVENAGPVSVTLKATSDGPLRHISRITLFRDSRRIDIRNEILENFDGTHTWSYSFNIKKPDVHHEEVGAILRAKLLANGGQYAPTMSRLEWLTLNHFADISEEGDALGVTLSNSDCAFMKLGDSTIIDGVSRLDVKTPQIQVLAGGQIDAPQAGIPKQGGDTHFLQRFALQTHQAYRATDAMRFALEHQNPLVCDWLRPGGTLPETAYSLLSISNPDVLLWSVKPADDGIAQGLVTRVWNLDPRPQDYTMIMANGITKATRTTHIETDIAPLAVEAGKVSVHLEGSQLQTMRLVPGGSVQR